MHDPEPAETTAETNIGTPESLHWHQKLHLRWLVLIHLAISFALGLVIWQLYGPGPYCFVAIWFGLVSCQMNLLAIWGSLGTSPWWTRLVGLSLGMCYFGALLDLFIGGPCSDNHLFTALVTLSTAGTLLILRLFGMRIRVPEISSRVPARFQFSIQQLLILTFTVACTVSVGKWLGPVVVSLSPEYGMFVLGAFTAVIGQIVIWPALKARKPLAPSLTVVACSAGLGLAYSLMFDTWAPPFWITFTSVEALSLLATLLVIRAYGYRLVRLPATAPEWAFKTGDGLRK